MGGKIVIRGNAGRSSEAIPEAVGFTGYVIVPRAEQEAALKGYVRPGFLRDDVCVVRSTALCDEVRRMEGNSYGIPMFISRSQIDRMATPEKRALCIETLEHLRRRCGNYEGYVVLRDDSDATTRRHEIIHSVHDGAPRNLKDGLVRYIFEELKSADATLFSNIMCLGGEDVFGKADSQWEKARQTDEFVAMFMEGWSSGGVHAHQFKEAREYVKEHAPEKLKDMFEQMGLIWPK